MCLPVRKAGSGSFSPLNGDPLKYASRNSKYSNSRGSMEFHAPKMTETPKNDTSQATPPLQHAFWPCNPNFPAAIGRLNGRKPKATTFSSSWRPVKVRETEKTVQCTTTGFRRKPAKSSASESKSSRSPPESGAGTPPFRSNQRSGGNAPVFRPASPWYPAADGKPMREGRVQPHRDPRPSALS